MVDTSRHAADLPSMAACSGSGDGSGSLIGKRGSCRQVPIVTILTSAGYGVTRKFKLLVNVRAGVVTLTLPVVAAAGTVVVISVPDTTMNVAALPLKVTLLAPVKLFPRIVTAAPTLPEPGLVSTKAPRPSAKLKTVPHPAGLQALPPD